MEDAQESFRQYNLGIAFRTDWVTDRKRYEHADAVTCFQKAIEAHPQNLLGYQYLASELRHLNRFDETVEAIKSGLKAGEWSEEINALLSVDYTTDEIHEGLWHELGLTYADSSNLTEAAKAFGKAIQLAEEVGKGPGLVTSGRLLDAVRAGRYDPKENRLSMERSPERRSGQGDEKTTMPDDKAENTVATSALPRSHDDLFLHVENLVRLMDDGVTLPLVKLRVPLDPIVGLIPGIGDVITMFISGSIIARAKQVGVERAVVRKMVLNLAMDCLLGAVPLLGDVFDFFFRANKRNLRLLHEYSARVGESH